LGVSEGGKLFRDFKFQKTRVEEKQFWRAVSKTAEFGNTPHPYIDKVQTEKEGRGVM